MANTLTDLIPDMYTALDVVSRELVGMIPSVTMDATAARVAVGQTIRSPVAPAVTAANITPGQLPPDTGDQVIGNENMTITKARGVPVRWNGEEQLGLDNGGAGYSTILGSQFEQAMRTLTNEIESDLTTLHTTTSRAFGAAGTTPFASNLKDTAEVRKILVDNGAPISDMQLVIDTTAGAKMRTLTQLTKANEASDTSLLRQGVLLDVHGMQIRESAQIETFTAGSAASATVNDDGYAVGATVLTLTAIGTGAILAGDFLTFAGDTNIYGVASGDADVSGGGTITLQAPGLRVAMSAATKAITVIASSARNMVFSRSAIVLATRIPARPKEGDSAVDVTTITDARSGMSFEVAMYKEYRQVHYEISAAWGFHNFKTEHTAVLLG